MSMESCDYTVTDDSGLLALVGCTAYRSFFSADWTYDDIRQHFNKATKERTLAVRECGDGGGSYVVG